MANNPLLGSFGDVSGGSLMFRNKLINGDFRVWQRGNSFSSLASYAYHADRWLADGAVTSGTTLYAKAQSYGAARTCQITLYATRIA